MIENSKQEKVNEKSTSSRLENGFAQARTYTCKHAHTDGRTGRKHNASAARRMGDRGTKRPNNATHRTVIMPLP